MTSSCLNRDISYEYSITIRKKLNVFQKIFETLTLNGEYKNFVNAHPEAAAEYIATKLGVKNKVP